MKKLTLKKEVVAELSGNAMNQVRGGTGETYDYVCATHNSCSYDGCIGCNSNQCGTGSCLACAVTRGCPSKGCSPDTGGGSGGDSYAVCC